HLVSNIVKTYDQVGGINHIEGKNLPSRDVIIEIFLDFLKIIFPGYYGKKEITRRNISFYTGNILDSIYERLSSEIFKSLCFVCACNHENCDKSDCWDKAREICSHLLTLLPNIRRCLKGDISAAYHGDPAAKSSEEIIVSYPFVIAITAHRIAHELYLRNVELIPRIINEFAHSETGIDIHPGAKIGKNFFIDHGTGVVIGETSEIGNNVKIYQGVTLGALSIRKDKYGRAIKGEKRHPTIKNDVTIYAGATILGGKTVIGEKAVIGGNVWLTESVNPGVTVILAKHDLEFRSKKKTETLNPEGMFG
ncbi:MAG: serine O-acetyltransferase EpsC, partial [bacterium]